MVIAWMQEWTMEVVDIETAFLYGILDKQIFMQIHEGLGTLLDMNFDDEECLVLDKAIYGLVQAARQFHKRLTSVMESEMGFSKCLGDECLLIRTTNEGAVIVCVYINDTLCVGDKEAIEEFKIELKHHFLIKEEGEMQKYVGCKVKKIGSKSLIMYQDDLFNKIEKIFGDNTKDMQIHGAPAGGSEHIKRPDEGEPKIDREEQRLYRSGVGLLVYLSQRVSRFNMYIKSFYYFY